MVRGRQGSFEPVKTGQTSRFRMENMLRTKMPWYVLPAPCNGSTNDAVFSQAGDKAKTRQSSHELHVVNGCERTFEK